MLHWLKNTFLKEKDALITLGLALFHKDTPRYVKLLLVLALVYLLSPLDLIPDGIIGAGLIDDLIVVPGIVGVAQNLIPANVKYDLGQKHQRLNHLLPWVITAVTIAFLAWIALIIYIIYKLIKM